MQDEDRVLVRRHGGEQGPEVGGAGGQDHAVGGVAPGQSELSTVAAWPITAHLLPPPAVMVQSTISSDKQRDSIMEEKEDW